MTTQDLFDLHDAMHKVLCRLEVLQTDFAGRSTCSEINDGQLKDRLLQLTSNDVELNLFKYELQDLAVEMLELCGRDVQFTP